jgi:hypothetical protein
MLVSYTLSARREFPANQRYYITILSQHHKSGNAPKMKNHCVVVRFDDQWLSSVAHFDL